jgi:hypothetical protein
MSKKNVSSKPFSGNRKRPFLLKKNDVNETNFDTLVLVLGLYRYGWSARKIGRVISQHHTTVKALIDKALDLKEEGKLANSYTYEGNIALSYVGGTPELERCERVFIEKLHGK